MKNILFVGRGNQIIQNTINIFEKSAKEKWKIWYTYYHSQQNNYSNIYFNITDNNTEALSSLSLPCFECIVVAAWYGTDRESRNNKSIQERNVLSLYSLLTQLRSKKIVLLGSQEEYGVKSKYVSELTLEEPITEYGKAKLELYNKMFEFCCAHDIKLIELRIHSCYGIQDNDKKILFKIIYDLLQCKTVNMRSNCLQQWDFLFAVDIGEAVYKAIMMNVEDGVYNISSGEHRSLRQYLEIAHNVVGKGKLVFGSEFDSNVPDFIFSSDKFRKETGWLPQIDFQNGCGIIKDYLIMMKKVGE